MISKPSVEQLEKKIPVRFVIVNAMAKRSREVSAGAKVRINTSEKNPLTIAALELDSGEVRVVSATAQEDAADETAVLEVTPVQAESEKKDAKN
ncbi:MAG: DNA-directed RNA polymerase subunit omega [Clostridia bacterium]|jgi:DNA-directed RNA polymerase subunit K/omega